MAVHDLGPAHPERREDSGRGEVPQGLPADPPDDDREQEVAAVAVAELRAGGEVGAPLLRNGEQRIGVGRHGLVGDPAPAHYIDVIPESAGVVEQMPDGDGAGRVAGDLGEKLLDLVVEGEFAVLGQEHDRHGGELLGDRSDVEHRRRGDRHSVLDAGEAVAPGIVQPPLPHHSERAPRRSVGGEAAKHRIHPRRERGRQRVALRRQRCGHEE
jgi:hypothetical protein